MLGPLPGMPTALTVAPNGYLYVAVQPAGAQSSSELIYGPDGERQRAADRAVRAALQL